MIFQSHRIYFFLISDSKNIRNEKLERIRLKKDCLAGDRLVDEIIDRRMTERWRDL